MPDTTQIIPIFTSGQVLHSARPELHSVFQTHFPTSTHWLCCVCTPHRAFSQEAEKHWHRHVQAAGQSCLAEIQKKNEVRRILCILEDPDGDFGFVACCFLCKEQSKLSFSQAMLLRSITQPHQAQLRAFSHHTAQATLVSNSDFSAW